MVCDDLQEHDTGARAARLVGQEDAWVTWFFRIHLIFAGIGVLIAAGLLAIGDGSLSSRLLSIGLALVLGLWCWLMFTRYGAFTFETRLGGLIFLAVSLPLFVTVGGLHPAWQTLIFVAYWQIFSILPIVPAVVVATILTFGNIWAQQGPRLALPSINPGTWSVIVIAMVVSGAMALFIHAIVAQSRGRQELLEELAATRESLAVSERAAGIADERRRLAGEVHDTIAQDFTSIVMHLEAAEGRIEAGGSPAEHIAMAREAARNGLQGSRRIVHALLPDLLEGSGIDQAIATQAARWSRETGVPVTTTSDGIPIPLDRHTEVVLFRALQETLANITRHSQANRVTVTLSYLDDLAVLDVHDDGCGFDPARAGAGVGLQVMRQRLEEVGGSLEIESGLGMGTTIAVSVRGEREEGVDS